MQPSPSSPASASASPSRKRTRDQAAASGKKKLHTPPSRRLRMRLDLSDRIWAGRCGCKSPHCMADEFEFSSDTGGSSSDSGDGSDSDDAGDDHDHDEANETWRPSGEPDESSKRPPQDPADLVPMLLHLMLMM